MSERAAIVAGVASGDPAAIGPFPYYASCVPADVIAMKASSGGFVVILGVTGDRISSVLVGHEDVLLFE